MLRKLKSQTGFQIFAGIIFIALLNLMNSCFYYKVTTSQPPHEPTISKLQEKKDFFILHCKDQVWHLINITIDSNSVNGIITDLVGHTYYKTTKSTSVNRYSKRDKLNSSGDYQDEQEVLNEVHIYVSEYIQLANNHISIPEQYISKIEIYDPANAATTASFVFPIAIGGAVIVAGAISILNNSMSSGSCPFINVYDGTKYIFTGEIFSGAIRSSLERDDYLALPALAGSEGKYRLKMSNETYEVQYNNFAELIIADHPDNLSILIDKYGTFRSFKKPVAPIEAKNCDDRDILSQIKTKDTLSYAFDEKVKANKPNEAIILKFIKPLDADSAKIVIRAKNTLWLDLVFAKYFALFGKKYDAFNKRQESVPIKEQIEWALKQNIPLMLYIEKNRKWVFLDYYNIAGSVAFKDDILDISLDGVDSDSVKIKLEYGFLFWEIDYVGMDFSKNEQVKITRMPTNKALDENGTDLTDFLNYSDKDYYIQKNIGNEALLTFDIPELSEQQRTIILHTKGYYRILKDQHGKADKKLLKSFRNPGRMPAYSLEIFHKLQVDHSL
jgi:hypothetical protein